MIRFLIEDLDVFYFSVFEKAHNIGRLEFEANGYPYGGPDSIITLLRSYELIPFEVDEGGGIYKISWTTNYEYTLEPTANQQLN